MPEPSDPGNDSEPARQGSSTALTVAIFVAISAAAIFGAGLTLGGLGLGGDANERAALEAFRETYRRISMDFVGEAEPQELVEGAIQGMFETLDDPYSAYMNPDEYEATFAGISGEFEGIGARMGSEDDDGVACEPIGDDCQLRVTEVLPESPAFAAGLLDADVVLAVDELTLEGLTIEDAVLLIRGARGTDVTLTVERGDAEQDLSITRDVITSMDVRSAVLADGRVGYLRIDSFSGSAAGDFETQLRAHLDAGIDRLIVDVREDPGGFVDAAVDITSQFIDQGPVFWEELADGTQRAIDAGSDGLATDEAIELVVLIDDGSASASEIVAGALQDAGRAQLVGENSFGKGTVQEWTQLPGANGGFRLSVAKWLTRDKDWVHGVGLTPDVVVDGGAERFRPEGDDRGTDPQLARAVSLLIGPGAFASPDPLSSAVPVASAQPVSSPEAAPVAPPS